MTCTWCAAWRTALATRLRSSRSRSSGFPHAYAGAVAGDGESQPGAASPSPPPAFGACFELRLPRAVGCDDACAELGLTRHVVGTAPTEAAAFAFARDSDLLVTVPDITVRPADTVAGLTVLALPVELPPAPVYLSWHQRYDTDPAHVWLRDLARTALASCAEAGGPPDGATQGAGR